MGREMKLSLKTALAQVLAPQLQESLVLLAAPILEVKSKVNEELEKNPVLELEDDRSEARPQEMDRFSSNTSDESGLGQGISSEQIKSPELNEQFKEYFQQGDGTMGTSNYTDEEKRQHFFDSITSEQSLQEFLREQCSTLDLNPEQRDTIELLICYIDDFGYLR